MSLLVASICGYLIGSTPFGLLLAKLAGQGDIRNIGSGNIGATNVLRTGRKDLALATLILDAGKAGFAALLFGTLLTTPYAALFAGGAALIGHCFPIWLKFKGGKGVATFFGVLLATAWPVGLAAGLIWIVTAFVTKISSLSALLAAICAPIIAFILGLKAVALMAGILALVIFIRHRDNIKRIASGTESKIGDKKKTR